MAEREERTRETVERAAILKDGKVYDLPRPARHCDVMRHVVVTLGLDALDDHEQGFVTSTGRFVNRYMAARIAFRAKQTPDLVRRVFTSEELW